MNRINVFIHLMIISWLSLQINSNKINRCVNCDVSDLTAESSFRTVKLIWNYWHDDPLGFNVKFCELSVWNTNIRCRERLLKLNNGRLRNKINLLTKHGSSLDPLNSGELSNALKQSRPSVQTYDKLIRKNKHHYEAYIYDLRTLTNYTFQVIAEQFDHSNHPISTNLTSIQNLIKQNLKDKTQIMKKPIQDGTSLDENIKSIQVETKGFSARTENCLANSSDVIVNTGPLFNGKISVENSSLEECAVYGNRSYTQEVYHLSIDHNKCNSRKNNSRIETMIIVHENKDILTHNARRFLVVCSFLPESYTLNLKASVSMPTNLLKRKNFPNSNYQSPTSLYAVSRVDPASIDNLAVNEATFNKRPTLINRIQRHPNNHPGTLQEQFYKQKQQYLNNYLLNNRLNNSNNELNNEVVYNFERLPKSSRDARFLNNQPQHSNAFNTQRERNTQFQHYFTMTMVAVGSFCLFVIIIFNFISIPKIWSNQPSNYHAHRRKHHHHSHRYYKEQRKEQDSRSRKHREYRDFRLSLNKHYPNSFNSLSSNISNVSSNVASNISSNTEPYQQAQDNSYSKTKSNKNFKKSNRDSSPSLSSVL